MRDKHIAVISDPHCGHRVGLTPPKWWHANTDDKWQRMREACWNWYAKDLADKGPFDIVIVNGDCIDGDGGRSGGVELIEPDRTEQGRMAIEVIEAVKAKRVVMTSGTPYHTGQAEDFERDIAKHFDCKIGDHEWYDINGVVFDVKHYVGSSTVPYGGDRAIQLDRVWNVIWAEHAEQPRADVLIRSHVHCYDQHSSVGPRGIQTEVITPGLQGHGSRFGARQCKRRINFGYVIFDVSKTGRYSCDPQIAKLPALKAETLPL